MDKMFNIPGFVVTAKDRTFKNTLNDVTSLLVKPQKAIALPRHLQLEIITKCNLLCHFCPRTVSINKAKTQNELDYWEREMKIDTFKNIVSQFPNLLTLSLHGIGEPLMNQHIFEMIEYASQKRIKSRFTTNGSLLSKSKTAKLLNSGLFRMIVSIDGSNNATSSKLRANSNFDKIINNLSYFLEQRNKLKLQTPIVDVNMVVHEENVNEVQDVAELCAKLGVDNLFLSRMQPSIVAHQKSTLADTEWENISLINERIGKSLNIHLGGQKNNAQSKSKETHKCLHPWYSAMITLDGQVFPCCNIYDKNHTLGNVNNDKFSEIWNGQTFKKFRQTIKQKGTTPSACKWCPDF